MLSCLEKYVGLPRLRSKMSVAFSFLYRKLYQVYSGKYRLLLLCHKLNNINIKNQVQNMPLLFLENFIKCFETIFLFLRILKFLSSTVNKTELFF